MVLSFHQGGKKVHNSCGQGGPQISTRGKIKKISKRRSRVWWGGGGGKSLERGETPEKVERKAILSLSKKYYLFKAEDLLRREKPK